MPQMSYQHASELFSLPADLIISILRFIPLLPRVRTISLLCKQCHALVYRSIDTVREMDDRYDYGTPMCLTSTVLARLPSLTSLSLSATEERLRLPASLRHLELYVRGCTCFVGAFPPLTWLSLHLLEHREGVTTIITACASFLVSLELHIAYQSIESPELVSFLTSVHLPSLRYLTIGFKHAHLSNELCAFYGRHASQLETLTVTEAPKEVHAKVGGHDLPNLTELTWRGSVHPFATDMDALLARCPKLTALHTCFVPSGVSHALTALRSLALRTSWQLETAELNRFPQLTAVSIDSIEDDTVPLLQRHYASPDNIVRTQHNS